MRLNIEERGSSEQPDTPEMKEVASCWICNCPGLESSEFYPEVHYCGEEHRICHHPTDHEEPWPISVRYKDAVGRLLLAARDIDKGELIFTEKPMVCGPNHAISKWLCLACLKHNSEYNGCSACGWPVCNEKCAKTYPHTIECSTFAKIRDKIDVEKLAEENVINWSISAIRACLTARTNPKDWATLQRMISHRDEQRKRETWKLYKEHLVDFIRETCGLGDEFTEEEVEHVSGVIDVNSIRLATNGHGVYPKTSIMSHSCLPNTKTIMNEDGSVDVRAIVEIPQGVEITKTYVTCLETTQMRQERLRSGWYFNCTCLRCSDPLEALSFSSSVACLKCREGLVLSTNPLDSEAVWRCGDCGDEKSAEAINKLNHYFFSAISEAEQDCMQLDNLLEKAVKMFHPSHYIPTLCRIKLNTAFLKLGARNPDQAEVELLMRRKELLDEIHQVVETLEPGLSQRRGLSLFERGICHLQLGRELYDKKKFGKEDFIKLLQNVIINLDDCLECLEHSSYGTTLSEVAFKAGAARDDAESWLGQIQTGEL